MTSTTDQQLIQGFRLSPLQQHRFQRRFEAADERATATFAVSGTIDRARLRRAVEAVVARHDSLRTQCVARPGIKLPLQVVTAGARPGWSEADLAGLSSGDLETAARRLLSEPAAADPACRFLLARLGEARAWLLVAAPTLMLDLRSVGNLMAEIASAYRSPTGEVGGEEPVQYVQFSEWRNETLEDESEQEARSHWREQEAGLEPLALPFALAGGEDEAEPRSLPLPLTEDLGARLTARAAVLGVAPEALVAGAWAAFLGFLGRRADVLIFRQGGGRPFEELAGGIGLFAGPLPLRLATDPDLGLDEVVRRTEQALALAERWQGSFQPQDSPWLAGRWTGRALGFELADLPPAIEAAGLRLALESCELADEPYLIKLWLARREGVWLGELRYDGAQLGAEVATMLAGQWVALLTGLAEGATGRVRDLALLAPSDRERQRHLAGAHGPTLAWATIDQPCERFAAAHPESPALVFRGEVLSYGELASRSNRLAHHLRALGVGPEVRVALALERSIELVVAMLAVLKAGGAYLPVDLGLPVLRQAKLVEQAEVSLLIAHGRPAVADHARELPVVDLGAIAELSAALPASAPRHRALPENLAYVLFTSGSTGQPKAVGVEHRQLLAYLASIEARLGLGAGASYGHISSFAADLGHTSLWPALAGGGCLHLIASEQTTDPEALARAALRHPYDCLKIVPSHLKALLSGSDPAAVLPRRLLVLGGEALKADLIARVRALAPSLAILNHYGPTETTVGTFTHAVEGVPDPRRGIPLGLPLSSCRAYLLDHRLRPVPSGVEAELFLGGASVARGYLGQPRLTAERFLPEPTAEVPGARAYRTGDRARQGPGGEVWFEGRVDDQVKLRGFRIELGEIDQALLTHPAVREAITVLRQEEGGEARLVSYAVLRAGQEASGDELCTFLGQQLPAVMVPAAVVRLGTLPLNANGKVDRRALPAPEPVARGSSRLPVAPRTPTEEILAGIWVEVLGRELESVEDSFFDQGGHSLLAVQVMARVRRAFGLELPLRVLFEAPSVAAFARVVEEEMRAGGRAALPPIAVEGGPGRRTPLSFAQQRLWFLYLLDRESTVYNLPSAIRLSGEFELAVFARVMTEVVRRHAILRTVFHGDVAGAVQTVLPATKVRPPVIDLRGIDAAAAEAVSGWITRREALCPFDLERGPVFRVRVVRLPGDQQLLLTTMPHIVGDGWSKGILRSEVAVLYRAFAAGAPSPLPEPALQYGDFAAWQRRWFEGDALAAEVGFWRSQLEGIPPLLELPTDRPRTAEQGFAGRAVSFALPREVAAGLRTLARRGEATPFMVLVAAFQAQLGRYSNQRRLAVGTTLAGRGRVELEGLIGFFVNTLVLPADLAGDPPFINFLARVRATVLAAHAHQDLPFDRLVEELQPARDPSYSPIFQVGLTLRTAPPRPLAFPGLEPEPELEREELEVAKFDLIFALSDEEGRLSGVLQTRRELFDQTTSERIARHFLSLLAALVADPEQRLSHLPLLAASERAAVLSEWNDTAQPFCDLPLLHQRFAERAAAQPDALAVGGPEGVLSYGELDRRASHLAAELSQHGVGPDELVVMATDRSLARVVGNIAVHKAGGAFVSLDSSMPLERFERVLRETRAPVALVERALLAQSPAVPHGVTLLDLEAAPPPGAGPVLRTAAAAESLAYVIFTSGSTGQPKGVLLSHRNLGQLVFWQQQRYGITAADRGTQVASPAFDASVWELWAFLVGGASTHIPSDEVRGSVSGTVRWWAERRITLAVLTTASAEALFEMGATAEPGLAVRALSVGGDRLRRRPPAALPFPVYNHYGPSECTVAISASRVHPHGEALPPIGRPTPNGRLYVLDRGDEPSPVGVAGELSIGGPSVGRGYLRQPGPTAAAFLPDPFAREAGARRYRTGDRVRWRADGELDFLGRLDSQVKVRGRRVELGEVEAALGRHPGIAEAVALVREDGTGEGRLVAYLIAEGVAPALLELRRFLLATLPEYMVPAAFVVLSQWPLTTSGKVDRRALPAPPEAGSELPYSPPTTILEEELAAVWSEILDRPRVGIHESFFDLGGHSLLATRMMARVRNLCGLEVPLKELFEAPTIAGLAASIIRLGGQVGERAAAIPRRPSALGTELPLALAQERLWFLEQLSPGTSGYHLQGVLALEGTLHVAVLERALREVVERHEILRTRFVNQEGEARQIVDPARALPFRIVDLRGLAPARAGDLASRLAGLNQRAAFDLERGPLLRLCLLRLGQSSHRLLVAMHHIISDGWSMGVLRQEMLALYRAFAAGLPSPLAELPIQYGDYAVWQREALSPPVLASHLRFWRELLADVPDVLELPLDRPRPARRSFSSAVCRLRLDAAVASGLTALARTASTTLYTVLLAAFQLLLGLVCRQHRLAVGTVLAGRSRVELEGLIGFFVNTLVLPIDLTGNPSFRGLLNRVQQLNLAAQAHQDLPFERLVEELQPARDLSLSPLYQASFVWQQEEVGGLSLPDLEISAVESTTETGRGDLTLALGSSGEGLGGGLQYNGELFDATTVERLTRRFTGLLETLASQPERAVAEISLLSAAERHQVHHEWNDTATTLAVPQTLTGALAVSLAGCPDSVAVLAAADHLSAAELDRRSSALATRLVARGAGVGSRVGIAAERSLELEVAVIAALKAGAAYVPLDVELPAERLAGMIADSEAALILCQPQLGGRLPRTCAQLLALDPDAGADGELAPTAEVDGEDPAYAIFTSGSTGRPKAALNSHRGIVNRLRWMQAAYPLAADDRVLQKTPITFDVSVWELFWPLLAGARLVMAAPGSHQDPALLARQIVEERVTTIHFVPSMLRAFLDFLALQRDGRQGAGRYREGLRRVMASGEALPPHVVARFHELVDAELHNLYGPTEAAVDVTAWSAQGGAPPLKVPIGRPVANTAVHVLDGRLRQVPLCVAGELCLAGVQVGGGYWGRPALTAERFAPDPYSAVAGARLYRTGDRARWLTGGELEFLGRLDFQVKLRGLRIELAEIEIALARHPRVRAAVATVVETEPSSQALVAYVVADPTDSPDAEELRRFLSEHLPAPFLPSRYVLLSELPRTMSGKVDRRALPALAPAATAGTFLAPRNATEEALAAIWRDLLAVPRVGVHDNFFTLGGHSLLAIRLIWRIRRTFGVELEVRTLFTAPTIERLATLLGAEDRGGAPRALTALRAEGRRRPLFLVHGGGGNVHGYLDLVRELDADQPVYAFSARGLAAPEPVLETVEEMAASYLVELREVQPNGPFLLGGWSIGGTVAFEMARQLAAAGERVALLALLDSQAPQPSRRAAVDELAGLTAFAIDLGLERAQLPRNWQALSAEDLLAAIVHAARQRIDPDLEAEQVGRLAAVFTHHRRAALHYAGGSFQGKAVVVRASEPRARQRLAEDLGWGRMISGGCRTHRVPGDHYSFLKPPHLAATAAILRRELEDAVRHEPETFTTQEPDRASSRTAQKRS